MKLDGRVNGFGQGTYGAREFAEGPMAIAGLDGLHGGAQGGLILDGLGHEAQLRSKRCDLAARGAFRGERGHGGGFGIFEARSRTHAERVIDDQKHQPAAGHGGRVAVDEGIGEGENQQQQDEQAQREQQKITQAAMAR